MNTIFSSGMWIVRIIEKGQGYGLEDQLIHDKDEPMVEFFDARQDPERFTSLGQFVSRYYISDMLKRTYGALSLYGDIPEWTVSAEDMAHFHANLIAWTDDSKGHPYVVVFHLDGGDACVMAVTATSEAAATQSLNDYLNNEHDEELVEGEHFYIDQIILNSTLLEGAI